MANAYYDSAEINDCEDALIREEAKLIHDDYDRVYWEYGAEDLTVNYGIWKMHEKDKIYPNYPHVYDRRNRSSFTEENLHDFIEIIFENIRGGESVDPYVILYCLYQFYWYWDSEVSLGTCSKTLSRVFGCFILIYSTNYNRELIAMPTIRLPCNLLKYHWIDIYKHITIDDFLTNIVPSMYGMYVIPNKCKGFKYKIKYPSETKATHDSFAFFILCMRWLISEFYNITPFTRSLIIDVFKNFTVLGNYIMALPFSFFTPYYVMQRYLVVQNELELSPINQLALNFMMGFRNTGKSSDSKYRSEFKKRNPNYRYLNFKMYMFLSSYNFFGCKNTNASPIILSIKTLGILPFNAIDKVKLNERDRNALESMIATSQPYYQMNYNDAKELYQLEEDDYTYFSILNSNVNINEQRLNDSEENCLDVCSVCLLDKSAIISLPCLHKVTCYVCYTRLSKTICPVCRATIVIWLNTTNGDAYDNLQLCILNETYSMFNKLISY